MNKEMYDFEESLRRQERARTTIEKYSRQVRRFLGFLGGREVSKELVLAYRQSLLDAGRRPRSVNSDLSAIHSYLRSIGRQECMVQMLRVQRSAFISEERQLGEEEYRRLLAAAGDRKNRRLKLVMETICSTGIRVSELRYVTAEAVRSGRAEICLKGKSRTILLPRALRNPLLAYARECGIGEGCIFRTRSGKPLDRSNIWRDMKHLARQARVRESKVFPHNLRHLFARSYFSIEKNLAHLADILGHSSLETTQIYVAVSEQEHERTLNRMRLCI